MYPPPVWNVPPPVVVVVGLGVVPGVFIIVVGADVSGAVVLGLALVGGVKNYLYSYSFIISRVSFYSPSNLQVSPLKT